MWKRDGRELPERDLCPAIGSRSGDHLHARPTHRPFGPDRDGMLKRLSGRKWVTYEPYRGVTLTKSGKAAALDVIRRHRLLETFLTRVLGVPWDRVHEEAERLEHALSDYLEGRIDEYLGHPERDPHGSPIPAADGSIDEPDKAAPIRSARGFIGASRRGGRPRARSARPP